MKIDIRNWNNDVVGSMELPDEVFATEVNGHLVWEVVRAYLAGQRRGTHKAKTISDVAGSGTKPWKQKHTGRARAGHKRSPLWRHGGVTHGPTPRDYSMKVNKKARRKALAGVLSQRASEGRLLVLDTLELDEPKTKGFVAKLASLGVDGKVLFVDGSGNVNLHLASRNRREVTTVDAGAVNTYQVLNHPWVVVSQDAAQRLAEVLV